MCCVELRERKEQTEGERGWQDSFDFMPHAYGWSTAYATQHIYSHVVLPAKRSGGSYFDE